MNFFDFLENDRFFAFSHLLFSCCFLSPFLAAQKLRSFDFFAKILIFLKFTIDNHFFL